jgi:hypothetical protein
MKRKTLLLLWLLLVIVAIGSYSVSRDGTATTPKTISEWKTEPVADDGYIASLFGLSSDTMLAWDVGNFKLETPNSLIHTGKIFLVAYNDGTCTEKFYLTELVNDVSTLGPFITQLPTTNNDEQYKAHFILKGYESTTGYYYLVDNKHIYMESMSGRTPELEFPGLLQIKGATYKLMNLSDCGGDRKAKNWNILFSDIKDNLLTYGKHQDLRTAYRFKGDITGKIVFKTVDGSYITYEPVK